MGDVPVQPPGYFVGRPAKYTETEQPTAAAAAEPAEPQGTAPGESEYFVGRPVDLQQQPEQAQAQAPAPAPAPVTAPAPAQPPAEQRKPGLLAKLFPCLAGGGAES